MTLISIGEAARQLNVAPSTLRSWEKRFGYPNPARSQGGRRLYSGADVRVLGDALERGLSISSAVRAVHELRGGHRLLLRAALERGRFGEAETLVSRACLAVGVPRALEDVLLGSIESLAARRTVSGIQLRRTCSWAYETAIMSTGYLIAERGARVLLFDAISADSVDAVAVVALRAALAGRGVSVLRLSVPDGVVDACEADFDACIVAGDATGSPDPNNPSLRLRTFRGSAEDALDARPGLAAKQLVPMLGPVGGAEPRSLTKRLDVRLARQPEPPRA